MNSDFKPGGVFAIAGFCALLFGGGAARASVAYGTVNNCDALNDTGVTRRRFEIARDDCRNLDISHANDCWWRAEGIPLPPYDDAPNKNP